MSEDTPYAPAPDYGSAPPPSPSTHDEMAAPPQMGAFARLGNIFFGPGDVFEDVRRSPRGWWLPIVILLVVATGVGYVAQTRLGLTPEVLAGAAVDSALEQQHKTRKDLSDAERDAYAKQEKFTATIFRFGPVVGLVYFPIFFGIMAGAYYVILMILQAKTTYMRVLAVAAYSYFAPNVLKAVLQGVFALVKSPDDVDPQAFIQGGGLLTTSLSFLTSFKDHPALWTLLSWFDVFSIGFLVLLAIGFSHITLKRMKTGTAFLAAAAPYVIFMLLSTATKLVMSK